MPTDIPTIPALLLTEKQAAAALGGITVRTMYALRKQGLPFIRIGGGVRKPRIMYSPADLKSWIDAHKSVATAPAELPMRMAQ